MNFQQSLLWLMMKTRSPCTSDISTLINFSFKTVDNSDLVIKFPKLWNTVLYEIVVSGQAKKVISLPSAQLEMYCVVPDDGR